MMQTASAYASDLYPKVESFLSGSYVSGFSTIPLGSVGGISNAFMLAFSCNQVNTALVAWNWSPIIKPYETLILLGISLLFSKIVNTVEIENRWIRKPIHFIHNYQNVLGFIAITVSTISLMCLGQIAYGSGFLLASSISILNQQGCLSQTASSAFFCAQFGMQFLLQSKACFLPLVAYFASMYFKPAPPQKVPHEFNNRIQLETLKKTTIVNLDHFSWRTTPSKIPIVDFNKLKSALEKACDFEPLTDFPEWKTRIRFEKDLHSFYKQRAYEYIEKIEKSPDSSFEKHYFQLAAAYFLQLGEVHPHTLKFYHIFTQPNIEKAVISYLEKYALPLEHSILRLLAHERYERVSIMGLSYYIDYGFPEEMCSSSFFALYLSFIHYMCNASSYLFYEYTSSHIIKTVHSHAKENPSFRKKLDEWVKEKRLTSSVFFLKDKIKLLLIEMGILYQLPDDKAQLYEESYALKEIDSETFFPSNIRNSPFFNEDYLSTVYLECLNRQNRQDLNTETSDREDVYAPSLE